MKKILLAIFLLFSLISFSNYNEKRIQVKGTYTKEVYPTSAKLQFTITTQDENLDKASKQNSEILEKYKNLLKSENVNYEKINSVDYNTSKYTTYKNEIINKGQKEYETILRIDVTKIDLNILQTFIKKLSEEKIYKIDKNKDNSYSFFLANKGENSKKAYEEAINKFNIIKNKLKNIGIDEENIKISAFNNNILNLEKNESKKIEEHIVTHSFEITTKDMKNLGKFYDLASTLNIFQDYYIEYDIENKNLIEDELYEKAYTNALNKAKTILSKSELSLQKPITITDNSIGIIQPYSEYIYINNYNDYNEKIDAILLKSNSKLIEESKKYNTVVNPEKRIFSKTVYIEFEMDFIK